MFGLLGTVSSRILTTGFEKMNLECQLKVLSAVESLVPFMMVASPLGKDFTIVVYAIEAITPSFWKPE